MSADVTANPARGEVALLVDGQALVVRPSFAALVAFEEEAGSLLGFVERVGAGELRLAEVAALFWHCLADRSVSRERVGAAIVEGGLAAMTPKVSAIVRQILQGL